MKILNIGSMNIDYVYKVDHIVKEGETQNVFAVETNVGGKGLNQSVAASRAGGKVYHAGLVGKDGDILMDYLKESGVDIGFIQKSDVNQGHAIIQVDKEGKNSILVYGGSNKMITKAYVDEVLKQFDENDYLMLNNEISELEYIIQKAHERSMQIVLNVSPIDDAILNIDYDKVDYIVINEIEGEALSGHKEPEKILSALLSKYPNLNILLTLGVDGSLYIDKLQSLKQETYKVPVKDTTAAGDTFMGYFVAGLANGLNVAECLRLASIAASITVTKLGAAATIPYLSEVKAFKSK